MAHRRSIAALVLALVFSLACGGTSTSRGPLKSGTLTHISYDGKYLEIPAFDSAQVDIYEEFVVIHGLWENDPTQLMVPTHVIHHMSITP